MTAASVETVVRLGPCLCLCLSFHVVSGPYFLHVASLAGKLEFLHGSSGLPEVSEAQSGPV